MMKHNILALLVVIGLSGCGNNQVTPPQIGANDPIPPLGDETNLGLEVASSQTEKIVTIPAGGLCDNQQNFCSSGAQCVFDGPVGTCVEKEVLDLECSPEKSPVCGFKDGQKLAYLNECEARRHQAEIINAGLCQVDDTVVGNCGGRVSVIGNCNTPQSGFEFQANSGNCVRVTGRGCALETPFEDAESCLATCGSR